MAPTFLYTLTGGMMLVLAAGRTDQLAWRFLRLVGTIVLALLCGVIAWCLTRPVTEAAPAGPWTIRLAFVAAFGAAVIVLTAPLAARIASAFRAVCVVSGLAGLIAGQLAAIAMIGNEAVYPFAVVMAIVAQTLGALLLDSITVAWLLGHAYLTATKMTIAPLRQFSRLLLWAVALRIAFLLISAVVAWFVRDAAQVSILSHLAQGWIVLTFRVGIGLVAVGVFAYMVSDCVRLRSTQSATGILYFASLFAYVGELANLQLITQYGWPL